MKEVIESGEFVYIINRNDMTAWIAEGNTGGAKVYTLPESVELEGETYKCESVENGAFCEESELEELYIPDSYVYIDEDCFKWCPKLITVHIGKGLEWYFKWSFGGCSVDKVSIDDDNRHLRMSDDGKLVLSKDGRRVLATVGRNTVLEISVPEGVEKIEEGGISCCDNLERLTLPSTLKEIGPNGIFELTGLKSLVVPEGVNTVSIQGISWIENLEILNLPSTLKKFELEMLSGDCNLKELILRSETLMMIDDSTSRVDSLYDTPVDTCVLRVPADLVNEYKAHPQWGRFKIIEAI